jgi:hypothetical protein
MTHRTYVSIRILLLDIIYEHKFFCLSTYRYSSSRLPLKGGSLCGFMPIVPSALGVEHVW